MSKNFADDINRAMSGEKPEIIISLEGKRLRLSDLLPLSVSDLLRCQVTIRDHLVSFFEGTMPYISGLPKRNGIGYHYRNVGVGASVYKKSAIELVSSAYGTSKCFTLDGRVII